jgi:hypothetical protein
MSLTKSGDFVDFAIRCELTATCEFPPGTNTNVLATAWHGGNLNVKRDVIAFAALWKDYNNCREEFRPFAINCWLRKDYISMFVVNTMPLEWHSDMKLYTLCRLYSNGTMWHDIKRYCDFGDDDRNQINLFRLRAS